MAKDLQLEAVGIFMPIRKDPTWYVAVVNATAIAFQQTCVATISP